MGGAHRDEDTAGERCRGPQDQTAGGIPRRLVGVLVVLGCSASHLRGGQEESAEGERECGRRPRVGHEGTVQADADVGGGPAARCGDEAEADQGDQAKRAVACRRHKRQREDGAAEDAASKLSCGAAGMPSAANQELARVYACTPPLVEVRATQADGWAMIET